jgi:hypothetical protein
LFAFFELNFCQSYSLPLQNRRGKHCPLWPIFHFGQEAQGIADNPNVNRQDEGYLRRGRDDTNYFAVTS